MALITSLPFVFPGINGVRCAFPTRAGGVTAGATTPPTRSTDAFGGNIAFNVGDDLASVFANRKALVQTLHLSGLAECNQIHSDTMVFDPAPVSLEATPTPPIFPDGDGLATTRPGLGLMVKSADCQPVLIAHEKGRHIAALHVGWKGNRIAFLQSGIAAFCAHYDVSPSELYAVRGPSLGPAHAEFVKYATEWGDDFTRWYNRHTQTVNLWELTRAQLLAAGLEPERIFSLDLCTVSLPELFFSFRRDARCGRQGSLIWIEE
ncbi:MAG: polyphenol oxidase family protein [Bilophila sp.]